MKFAVIRHPDAGLGTCSQDALEHHKANGWIRVSEWRAEPADFHMPDFAEAVEDLDPPADPPAAEAASEPAADAPAEPAARIKTSKKEQEA